MNPTTAQELKLDELVLDRGGKRVLHGVSLSVRRGEITALVGPNGAGKSSTVMALAGLLPRIAGQTLLDGVPLAAVRAEQVRAAGIAVVPEGHRVLGDLSVRDNLLAAATALPGARLPAAVEQVLGIFPELIPKLALPGRALSGGQKQMVCVAQALIVQPRFLIVDELSLGLAPMVVKRLVAVLQQVVAQGAGVLLIEQFTTVALAVAQQAFVLERGRVAYAGTAAELQELPDILHGSYLAAG
jgi:branched-chain amino acid transport system ATP-binding protein